MFVGLPVKAKRTHIHTHKKRAYFYSLFLLLLVGFTTTHNWRRRWIADVYCMFVYARSEKTICKQERWWNVDEHYDVKNQQMFMLLDLYKYYVCNSFGHKYVCVCVLRSHIPWRCATITRIIVVFHQLFFRNLHNNFPTSCTTSPMYPRRERHEPRSMSNVTREACVCACSCSLETYKRCRT